VEGKNKLLLTGFLAFVWAGLAVWQWVTWKESVHVPLTNVTGPASSGRQKGEKSSDLRVKLELLASARSEREGTFTAPRNIFSLSGPDRILPTANETATDLEPPIPPEEALLQQAVAMEVGQYRYLGFLRTGVGGRKKKDLAVLSKNEEVVVAKVGDRVENHLVLKKITPDSVTIRDTGTNIDQTVQLSEEEVPQQ